MKVAIIYHSETGNTEAMANLVKEGCEKASGDVEARTFPVDEIDEGFVSQAKAVMFGCPTYEGTCSWQMKRLLDTIGVNLAGKLGGCFASMNWPGGGGAELAVMTMIAGMLVRGMLIYSGGVAEGEPYLHFGAVSHRRPEGLYAERCVKLGENITRKALELFGD